MKTDDRSILHLCVSAEVRAIMASRRITGLAFAPKIGVSQNYLAKRLRDERPFTITDIERIAKEFELDPSEFLAKSLRDHSEDVLRQLDANEAKRAGRVYIEDDSITPLSPKG